MNSCTIHRGKDGRIESVRTPSGLRSSLFDSLASIPVIENRERAASLYKKVFSDKFMKKFGTWGSTAPLNRPAYRKILSNIGKVEQSIRGAFLHAAAKMDNPIMVGRAESPENIQNNGLSYYSETDLSSPVLINPSSITEVDMADYSKPDNMSDDEFRAWVLSLASGNVTRFRDMDGSERIVVRNQVPVLTPSTISSEEYASNQGVVDEVTGEPIPYFKRGSRIYSDYGEALRSPSGLPIEVGFIAPGSPLSVEAANHPMGDFGYSGDGFIQLAEFSPLSRTDSYQGIINRMIQKGYLSGKKGFDPETGTYRLTGAGYDKSMRLFNSAQAYYELRNMLPAGDVTMDDRGFIDISHRDKTLVEVSPRSGSSRNMKKDEILNEVKSGNYAGMANNFQFFDELFLSLALERNRTDSSYQKDLIASLTEEDKKQKNAIVSILSSLGIRVMGMSEYLDKYKAKYGTEPSARALADMANGVIAIAEGATLEDLVEEAAHFLVESYTDQASIREILPEVESTAVWDAEAPRYYEIYSSMYEGEALDEAVRREVLGKLLRDRIIEETRRQAALQDDSFSGRLSRLASNIISSIRSMFTDQRTQLDEVLDRIRDSALADRPSGFNTELLRQSPFVLYSASEKSRNAFLRQRINDLRKTAFKLRQIDRSRGVSADISLNQLADIERKLSKADSELTDSESILSITNIISTASASVRYLRGMMDAYDRSTDKDKTLSVSDRANMQIVNEEMLPMLVSLRSFVQRDLEFGKGFKYVSGDANPDLDIRDVKRDLTAEIDRVISQINELSPRVEATFENDSKNLMDRLFERWNVPMEYREDLRKKFNGIQNATSFLSRWFGILEHSSNVINGALGALIAENNYKAMLATRADTMDFIRRVKSGNWKISDFEKLIKKYGDNYSSYLISPLDMARFEHDYKVQQMKSLRSVLDVNTDDLTDEMIENIVSSGKKYKFKIPYEQIDAEGNVVTAERTVEFRPSRDRIRIDFLNAAQEQAFNANMRLWIDENTERMFKDDYVSLYDRIYSELESEGNRISERTKEYIKNEQRERYMIRSSFMKEDGTLDYPALYRSGRGEDLQRIRKAHRAAASEYIYIGGQRVLRDPTEPDGILARELRLIDEKMRAHYASEARTGKLSNEFFDMLHEAQYRRENGMVVGSASDAWTILTNGGHISFSEKFWDDLGYSAESRTEENNNANYEAMAKEIVDKSPDPDYAKYRTDEILKTLRENREAIREVMSQNRDNSDPGEMAVGSMSSSEMEVVARLTEQNEEALSELISLAKQLKINVDDYLSRPDITENSTNKAYFDALRDSGYDSEHEYEFAMKHMTPRKAQRVRSLLRKVNSFTSSPRFSNSEKVFLAQAAGIKSWRDDADFTKKVKAWREETTQEERNRIISDFARQLVLPYFKKMSPEGYSDFLQKIKKDEIDMAEFVRDLTSGMSGKASIRKYGMDISYLEFSPNREWESADTNEDNGRNPNFEQNSDFGRFIPKYSKYLDKDYFSHFGINEGDIHGKATKNKEEFEMLENLLEINRTSYAKYGESGRSAYLIPQISKNDIDRLASLRADFFGTVENYVRDLVSDRVDDSLYGRTDASESVDVGDRIKAVPKYYINELENQDDVTHDLAFSFSMLVSQANLYAEKQNTLADAMGLQQMLLNSQFSNGKKAEATYAYSMFKDFMDAHYYGMQLNNKRLTVSAFGTEFDITKLVFAFNKFLTTMNIALSPFVAATGAVTGQANFLIEGAVGQYLSRGSIRYAYKEMARMMPSYVGEAVTSDIDRNSKLYVLGESLGIFSFRNRVRGAGYSGLARVATRDIPYRLMEILNSPLDPQIMVASMDSVRYFKDESILVDGKPMTGRFFTEQELRDFLNANNAAGRNVKTLWRSLRENSLWKAIDVENGMMVGKSGKNFDVDPTAEFMRRRNRVRSLMQICNGSLNEENRIGAVRNIIGHFLTAHRGWLFLTAQRLWKKRGFNFQTMQYEEGLLNSVGKLISGTVRALREGNIRDLKQLWDKVSGSLEPDQRLNAIRMAIYSGVFALLNVMMYALSGWRDSDDDDDEWVTQFVTYVGMRTVNEISSQMPLLFGLNIVDAVEDPFVMARKLGDLTNLNNWSMDRVTSGAYEGETKLWRLLCKMTFLKQWYNVRTPDAIKDSSDYWLLNNQKSMMFFWGGRPSSGSDEEE